MSNGRLLSGAQMVQTLNGVPTHLGVLTSANSTTPVDNGNTAVAFNATGEALKKKTLLVQPTVGGTLNFILASTGTVPASTASVFIAANERVLLVMDNTKGFLTWRAEAAVSSALKVFEMS